MKLLLWDCKFIRFKDVRASTRPRCIKQLLKTKSSGQFKDTLAVFICIEDDDKEAYCENAAKEIRKLLDMLNSPRDITIIPFAHLSSNIASPHKAISLIHKLANQLKASNLNVNIISFGYHKEFELHFLARGHPGSVAFREIK